MAKKATKRVAAKKPKVEKMDGDTFVAKLGAGMSTSIVKGLKEPIGAIHERLALIETTLHEISTLC